ncbi:MAG: hypothetical protein GY862_10925 [Gammaproteobacteria bacterium]|nr:hypothetical protein [Gammaproteobacteria bacterium]
MEKSQKRRCHAGSDKGIFHGLLVLMVWAPLPYASNHAWAWAILEIGIFTLTLVWLWKYLRGEVSLTPVFHKARPILILWLMVLLYIGFQCLPLPHSWVESISSQAAWLHSLPKDISARAESAALSVDPYATTVGLLKTLSYVLLFSLALLTVRSRTRIRQIAYALVFSGLFQAVYGSLMTLSGLEFGFFHEKVHGRGVATGTFVNRNHLAGYLGMCLAMGIGLLIAQLEESSENGWRQRLVSLFAWILSAKMRLRLYLVMMVIALVMTHSRMGNTAFFAGMCIAGVIGLLLSRHATRATMVLLISLVVIDIFIVGAWFGLEKVTQRIEQTTLTKAKRDEVDIYSFRYWQDYRLTGSGLGSYYAAFPRYQRSDTEGFWKHAHNDYLEFATETGLIGLILLSCVVLLSLRVALLAQFRRHDPLARGVAFSVAMTIIILLIHSSVDFNLQIPANAATFMLLLALGWVACYRRSSSTSPVFAERRSRPWPVKFGTTALMAGLIYSIYVAGSQGVADSLGRLAKHHIKQWESQTLTLSSWQPAADLMKNAIKLDPLNPLFLQRMGQLYFMQDKIKEMSKAEKLKAYRQAASYYRRAVTQSPANALAWTNLFILKYRLRQYDSEFVAAMENAGLLAPWNPKVQRAIADIGMIVWYRLPKNIRNQGRNSILSALERGLQMQAEAITALIKKHRRIHTVCFHRGKNVLFNTLCRSRKID